MMDEKHLNGGPGIDTRYERSVINYNPKLDYELQEFLSSELRRFSDSLGPNFSELTEPRMASLWNKVANIIYMLNELEAELAQELRDIPVPVPTRNLEALQEAAAYYGVEIGSTLPFALYQKSLYSKPSNYSQLIQEAFESYYGDIDGTPAGEVYSDVVEMKQDWSDMAEFMKTGVFSQIMGSDNLPMTIIENDPKLDYIHQAEMEIANIYSEVLIAQQKALDKYNQVMFSGDDSPEANIISKAYMDLTRQAKDLERRLTTKTEVVSIVETKSDDAYTLIDGIRATADHDPYSEDAQEVLYHLLRQYPSGQLMDKGLRKMQVLLKMSLDGKNDVVGEEKANLRGIGGADSKRKINRTLSNGVHLQNEITGNIQDTISGFEGIPNNPMFEEAAMQLVQGLELSDDLYNRQLEDFNKVHGMDTSLRQGRTVSLMDKNSTRELYHVLNAAILYAEKNGWPSQAELSSWTRKCIDNEYL